jgi:MSHA pilin protein MshD
MKTGIRKTHRSQKGVTLIEMVITIVILGIALSALISSLSSGISQSATPLWESRSLELTQAYLDEILAMKFDGTQPLGGGVVSGVCAISSDGQSRANFDDVDDYNGLNDSPPQLIETTLDMSTYSDFSVLVSVSCSGTELNLSDDAFAKRIVVTVNVPGGQSRSVAVYKGNF